MGKSDREIFHIKVGVNTYIFAAVVTGNLIRLRFQYFFIIIYTYIYIHTYTNIHICTHLITSAFNDILTHVQRFFLATLAKIRFCSFKKFAHSFSVSGK